MSEEIHEFDFEKELGQWDVSNIPRVTILGMSGAGKSRLAVRCARHMAPRFGTVVIISPSQSRYEKPFGELAPRLFMHKEPTVELLETIYNDQERLLNEPDALRSEYETMLLLIIDDAGSYPNVMKSPAMTRIYNNGRPKRIAVITTVQYFNMCTPACRTSTSYLFALQEDNKKNLAKEFDEFFGAFGSKALFEEAMKEFTTQYGFLVAKKKQSDTGALSEKVFYGRCTLEQVTPDYRIGSPFLWLLDKYYALTDEERRQVYQRFNEPEPAAAKPVPAARAPTRFKRVERSKSGSGSGGRRSGGRGSGSSSISSSSGNAAVVASVTPAAVSVPAAGYYYRSAAGPSSYAPYASAPAPAHAAAVTTASLSALMPSPPGAFAAPGYTYLIPAHRPQ